MYYLQIGPMARDCRTAASILTIIAGKDAISDPAAAAIPFESIPDYGLLCSRERLPGARIGM